MGFFAWSSYPRPLPTFSRQQRPFERILEYSNTNSTRYKGRSQKLSKALSILYTCPCRASTVRPISSWQLFHAWRSTLPYLIDVIFVKLFQLGLGSSLAFVFSYPLIGVTLCAPHLVVVKPALLTAHHEIAVCQLQLYSIPKFRGQRHHAPERCRLWY